MKLSEAERDVATRTVVEQAAGRAPVVVNTGAPSTAVTVQYSRRAEELGADASMITPPIGVSAEVTKEYYRRVSDATTIPIFIQDVPTAAVSPVLVGEMAREIKGVQYIKAENPPTPASIAGFVEEGGDALTVFGGAGGAFFVEEMRRGSVGIMPHAALPDLFRSVWDYVSVGRRCRGRSGVQSHDAASAGDDAGGGAVVASPRQGSAPSAWGVHVGQRAASRRTAE